MSDEFIIHVFWSKSPNHTLRQGEVMADVGCEPPDPPLTNAEMQEVTRQAKLAVLKALRARKKKKP
jgi:hypothetical protein